ncbi:MAG: bifunctional phosphopantothenoylcysteine decarboxylase/phosphopantothenate--cysteine ligase CoaBC [Firmicutes bacterium]|nr:bifunctional phosphopantothenoylcysteine decarboxylase/phosphopantothenate--cysteine ligase CoaBC [Bacillota bacterium]
MFENRNIIIGISGGIACYKIANLVSALSKTAATVDVIMTENACQFIRPLVFETLSGRKCYTDTFGGEPGHGVAHIELAKKADVFMVAPATANVIAKIAHGIADDMLTTTFLAASCRKIVVPAMNSAMLANPVTQDNLAILARYGIEIVEPAEGHLACGTSGKGKMPEAEELFAHLERACACEKDLAGKKVLVTAGATQESLDPVRFISNHSSGKMGFAVAREAMRRGAEVTVVKAFTTAEVPPFCAIVPVRSAEEMFQAVAARAEEADIIIKAAAVADYTPLTYVDQKIKKKEGDLAIPLKRTTDILKYLGEHKREGQFLCGFSMETENMVANTQAKLVRKNADMMVANNLKETGSGFGTDTNRVTIITPEQAESLDLLTKEEVAKELLDRILRVMAERGQHA